MDIISTVTHIASMLQFWMNDTIIQISHFTLNGIKQQTKYNLYENI
jgi:hypothetical protein